METSVNIRILFSDCVRRYVLAEISSVTDRLTKRLRYYTALE